MRADLADLPTMVCLADSVRQQEPQIAARLGLPLYEVMEQAGKAAFELLRRRWPEARRLLVLCGSGNNAGDGYVLARLAKAQGLQVELLQLDKPLQGDALRAQQRWLAEGGTLAPLQLPLPNSDLCVDALLGTGFHGQLRPPFDQIIPAINQLTVPVLALDLPSGVDGQTGDVPSHAVQASATITFVATKLGLLTAKGLHQTGELSLAPFQLGGHCAADGQLLQPSILKQILERSPSSHKGDHGRLLLLGGAEGMAGALRLASEAALRSGTGLVAAGCAATSVLALVIPRPEIMAFDVLNGLTERLAWAQVLAIGPGLGQSTWSRQLWQQGLAANKPMLVDADGLNLLAENPIKRDNWLLTPHPGEAARLLNCAVTEIEADRLTAAQRIQQRYGGVVVLKGSGTLIVSQQQWAVAPVGNAGLATGGSGDLLSGIIAGLVAQGHPLYQAACFGVVIHGEAADGAAASTPRGMLPSDLLTQIRFWVNQGTL